MEVNKNRVHPSVLIYCALKPKLLGTMDHEIRQVRLTGVEETTDVVCSIMALRLLRAHPLSRCLYNIVITFLLVELHWLVSSDLPNQI